MMIQGLIRRRFWPKPSSSPFQPLNGYRTQSPIPILGPDLPDIWDSRNASPLLLHRRRPSPATDVAGDSVAKVIDGKSIAEGLRSEIAEEVRKMRHSTGNVPGLAVIMVGKRRDSQSYVRFKTMACHEVGINSHLVQLPEDCVDDEVVCVVSKFNSDPSVHGILVQLPLPQCELSFLSYKQHMMEEKILSAISLEKDVDGFHPMNMGNLALMGREPLFIPCAAMACIELLLRSDVEIMGKRAVVIGRSKVVGLPTSLLLQRHHATVSIVHALTKNPEEITREADIVVSAAGVTNLVHSNWLKPRAVVIDVGTNPIEDPSCEYGYRLTGDVCYEEVLEVASAITPVPGGVGPVTIAMLLSNTLDSAKRAYGFN
ncbi:hypothetical protein QJS04_geneDACA016936 [Acorus gramineus]|uniref:Methenyltetrahydrofolate cyclohydrolase n=1 Tax=Acorus gramineus TaxID=55184 RepID=A0AAV9AKI5_ACOGR|nr:hypothetical protein QJS04_geneDACA016936 [Acorus gramineus]